jgi:branched-subunit amino acid transport protein AzlD
VPSSSYLLGSLVAVLAVTLTLRALPFLFIGPLRDARLIRFFGVHLPSGVMVVLVVYTVRDVPLTTWPHGLPEAIGIAVTAGLHLWRRNAVVSILAGTGTYMVLVGWAFG